MNEIEKSDIIEFLRKRGANDISIQEMLDWCNSTGANTIEQVHNAGYEWDWWDRNGKLNYE